MISFFTTAKPFVGHAGVIQRNAIRSWKELRPECEVILLGDDDGCADVARALGLIHVPEIARNEYGTPLLDGMFAAAHAHASHKLLCFINADIILMSDFIDAARRVSDLAKPFLMCGRRSMLDVTEELTFGDGWEDRLRRDVIARGRLDAPMCVDYFLFTHGLFPHIPPFAIGRKRWDRWLQYQAWRGPGQYIDASDVVTAVHQNHGYGSAGAAGTKRGPEAQRNAELAGDQYCDLRRATHKVTPRGVTRAMDALRVRYRVQRTAAALADRIARLEGALPRLFRQRPKRLLHISKSLRRMLKRLDPKRRKIAVVGLGRLGLPLAVCFADKGYEVVGIDLEARVAEIEAGQATAEKGVARLMARARPQLIVQADADAALADVEVILVAVPTQRPGDRAFTPDHVLSVCASIARVQGEARTCPLVVIVSTMLPGWTGGIVRAALEQGGKTAGRDFGLCYWPQFVALGQTVEGFLAPDFALIGESDPDAGRACKHIISRVWRRHVPVVRTSFVNAEVAKLALNTYVPAKISFANTLARLCERLPGADVDVVTSVLELDPRVGRGFLRGGLSYGGPCFPGDVPAFAAVARELGAPDDLARATDAVNTLTTAHVVALVQRSTAPGRGVAILGASYKAGSGVTDGAPPIWIAQELQSAGYRVILHDPYHTESLGQAGAGFHVAQSLTECIRAADTLVLALPYRRFARLDPALLQAGGIRRTIIDCWRILDPARVRGIADYHALGRGPADPAMVAAAPALPRAVEPGSAALPSTG